MKIGYSCWGFLGNGIVDTPDGGRSHRFTLIRELIKNSADVIMLQKNRDLIETGKDYSNQHLIFDNNFSNLDALFLEYRWKIPGRNCKVSKDSPLYTPDLDRQNELLNFYRSKNIPILVWDKDQKVEKNELRMNNVVIFEAALKPRFNRKGLLFPVDLEKRDLILAQLKNYSKVGRIYQLIYIGNQYERDDSFKEFIDKSAKGLDSEIPIFGNWNKYRDKYKENLKKFPNVIFKGKASFKEVIDLYKKSLVTVLIAPKRYYESGQFTQRLFESLCGMCIPLAPVSYFGVEKVILRENIVKTSKDVIRRTKQIRKINDKEIGQMLKRQLRFLDLFDVKKQVKIILKSINAFYA